jgi:hypothetical protein
MIKDYFHMFLMRCDFFSLVVMYTRFRLRSDPLLTSKHVHRSNDNQSKFVIYSRSWQMASNTAAQAIYFHPVSKILDELSRLHLNSRPRLLASGPRIHVCNRDPRGKYDSDNTD